MYEMFCEERQSKASEDGPEYIEPIKEHLYRDVFRREFNIDFHKPKKDRCDICEAYKAIPEPSQVENQEHAAHVAAKMKTKEERDADRKDTSPQHATVCFDLQNVISLPRANISSFFYRRKLAVYNLTAHCSTNKRGYCAIWNEGMSGRSGNDIASSVVKILQTISTDNPQVTRLTLWSDSCISQNKNRVMSLAVMHYLESQSQVESILQKFGTPGHSPIQEVDNLHSQIEKTLSRAEIFSPVGLLRTLKLVNRRNPLRIIQMRQRDFMDFHRSANLMNFDSVPFMKVREIEYMKDKTAVKYRVYGCEKQTMTDCVHKRTSRQQKAGPVPKLPSVKVLSKPVSISAEKKTDIKAMMKFMAQVDKTFYANLFAVH